MPGYLPLVVATAAVGLTYLFCIRPMRRHGSCHRSTKGPAAGAGLAGELELARTELELLRLQQARRAEDGSSHTTGG